MILSVSRRTDVPNYYSDWFVNRIKEGFLYVRNPMNAHQISRIDLSPDVVDCIVFWTKNPANMMEKLECLKDYVYYFQFTLTGYGKDIEPNLPNDPLPSHTSSGEPLHIPRGGCRCRQCMERRLLP